jgi:hypothetical protein
VWFRGRELVAGNVGPTGLELDMVLRGVRVVVESGKPLRFEDSELSAQELSASDAGGASDAISKTFRAYLKALNELLATRYSHAADTVPAYMKAPCQVTVLRCTDALFVRYDIVDENDKAKVRVVNTAQPVETVAPAFSDAVVHAPSDPTNWTHSAGGPKLGMSIIDPTGGVTREIMSFSPAIVISPNWPEGVAYPAPPSRPSPVASLLNEFEFEMSGFVEDAAPPVPREVRADPTHFTVRSRIVLQTGWRAIEVYPLIAERHWLPEAALQWAETDLLFALFQRNTRDQELAALDGRAEKRRQVVALLSEFETLLAGAEEPMHQFLKKNPILLYPTYDRLWSKVPFGAYVGDFVVRESPDDYVLVEIEAPHRELFRRNGHLRHEFTHAIGQITDWLAYLADHRAEVAAKYDMRGISVSPRGLIVIGRSRGLTDDHRRKLATIQERQPRLRILTYDDVIANARAVFEKILGPLSLVVTGNAQVYFHGPVSQ